MASLAKARRQLEKKSQPQRISPLDDDSKKKVAEDAKQVLKRIEFINDKIHEMQKTLILSESVSKDFLEQCVR